MSRYFIASLVSLLALLTIAVSPNLAQARKNQPQRRAGRITVNSSPRVIILPSWEERSVRPPGWNRGIKTGWSACNVPPGQAKKFGCTSTFSLGGRNESPRRPVIVIPLP